MNAPVRTVSTIERWSTFLFPVLVSALAFGCLIPPRSIPASAPPHEFSAERAFEHLKVIAKEPRPTGSVANVCARDYLVDQLKSLGLEPQIQKAVALRRASKSFPAATYRTADQ